MSATVSLEKGLRQRALDCASLAGSKQGAGTQSSAPVGFLLGTATGAQIVSAVPLLARLETSTSWSNEVASVEACVPAGIRVVGLFEIVADAQQAAVSAQHFSALKKSLGDDRVLYYFRISPHSASTESTQPSKASAAFTESDGALFEYNLGDQSLRAIEPAAISWTNSAASLVTLRAQGDIFLDFKWAASSIDYLSGTLQQRGEGFVLQVAEPGFVLQSGDDRTLKAVLSTLPAFKGYNAKQIESHVLERPLLADVLFLSSISVSNPTAPLISIISEPLGERISATLGIDIVVQASIDAKVSDWVQLAHVAYRNQVSRILATFTEAISSVRHIITPSRSDHPEEFPLHTPIIPIRTNSNFPNPNQRHHACQLTTRKSMHARLGLAEDLPYFRFARIHSFLPPPENPQRLRDPHIGLPPSGVKGAQSFLVKGSYDYYHYMQDRFDDNGWGCAYRSLQTICSWFIRQGYTSKPPPTIPEIQQTLVKIGDKPASFVGSRQWIGSMELGWVLEEWYKSEFPVVNRCLAQIQGSDLQDHARTLAHHFETQGTPIMIGGAAMAHTILGIDFNPEMGTLKYLVLDPHYTGAENLKTIQSKGWCGWKEPGFWNPNAPYNLCLPQKPAAI